MLDRNHKTSMLKGKVNKARDDCDCIVLLAKKKSNQDTTQQAFTQQSKVPGMISVRGLLNSSQCNISYKLSLGYETGCWHSLWYILYTHNATGI